MKKLWNNNDIYAESCMFAGSRQVELLFDIDEIKEIVSPVSGVVYSEHVDYTYIRGSNTVTITENSRIPFTPASRLHPKDDLRIFPADNSNAIGNAVDGGYLLFNNESLFANLQVEVSYKAMKNDFCTGLVPQRDRLPKLRNKIICRGNLDVVLLGDSISQGYNSTKFTNTPPFNPCYMEQVCSALNTECKLQNFAVSGTGIHFARQIYSRWAACRPDLLVIAYGMNNFSSTPVEKFIAELDWIIKENSAVSPDTEYIVVTPMTGNSQWKPTVPGADVRYAEAMRKYVNNSPSAVALADVQQVWLKLLERKKFYDLTGNGVNHPNDYGHRVYASVILDLLG